MTRMKEQLGMKGVRVDWVTILIYLFLVLIGWVNIYAAVNTGDQESSFSFSSRYGMQLIWIGVSLFVAISLLLIESRYFHIFAYVFYVLMLFVMVYVALFGDVTNNARSWLSFGSFKIQPVEFMKIATALALARYISSNAFDISRYSSIFAIAGLIFLPVLIILLQNDTGSALVFFGFFLMLYRVGLGRMLYLFTGLVILLSIMSFLIEPIAMLIFILLICIAMDLGLLRNWKRTLQYLSVLGLLFLAFVTFLAPFWALILAVGVTLPAIFIYAHKHRISKMIMIGGVFISSVIVVLSVDFVFDNVLQIHQQKRILDLLGLEEDPQGWSYNVNQSKIAIGSGGFFGKGFLNGTQTKYNFVPEQDTDFIFCTVGEEWGFVGSMVVVILFGSLIVRLILMGERQQEPFARVYCYSAAAIFFAHFTINIGMTIGLFPVVGIPLPFFSYGGSSLLAFTILLFIAIKLDSRQIQ